VLKLQLLFYGKTTTIYLNTNYSCYGEDVYNIGVAYTCEIENFIFLQYLISDTDFCLNYLFQEFIWAQLLIFNTV